VSTDALRIRFPEPSDTPSQELRLASAEFDMVGVSISAIATAFALNAFATAVDMGRCSALLAAQETVLLTHCHSDHVAGLVAWLSAHTRRYEGAPTRVIVPEERHQALLQALEVWPDLDGVTRRVDLREALVPAGPGQTFALAAGASARSFEPRHSPPSLGWTITAADHDRPSFVFAGDGTVEPFRTDPSLLDAEVAVVDCSFIDDGTRVAARLGGHGHLQDWLDLLPALPCDTLVLAHMPAHLTAADVLARLRSSEDAGPILVPWLPGP
jgi:glyoxylase-like metal-dependent hydrolase (beta-lactamase superfamily II)